MSAGFAPLRVRAHLAFGIAQAAPWGVALDGLLASQIWARYKAERRSAGGEHTRALDHPEPPDLELPLERCSPAGSPWHWAATCAWPDTTTTSSTHPLVEVRTWTGRVDARALESVAPDLPKTISARQGRYRSRRMPLLVTTCRTVTWQAIGDVDAISDLLEDLEHIGKKRTSGEGQVLRWEVTPAPNLDAIAAAHLHPDGTLGRTTPPPCRARLGQIEDGGLAHAGLRPPYMHPARQHDLYLPALLGT